MPGTRTYGCTLNFPNLTKICLTVCPHTSKRVFACTSPRSWPRLQGFGFLGQGSGMVSWRPSCRPATKRHRTAYLTPDFNSHVGRYRTTPYWMLAGGAVASLQLMGFPVAAGVAAVVCMAATGRTPPDMWHSTSLLPVLSPQHSLASPYSHVDGWSGAPLGGIH